MARTVYYTATSLDGFIADADGSLQWLFDVPRAEEDAADSWEEFIGAVGALVLGSTTYEWVVEHEGLLENPQRWKEFYDERPSWVLSSRDLPPLPGVDIRFASGDVRPVHAEALEAAAGKDVWVVGGGDLAGQLHDAGLLDRVVVSVAPVTLGAGAPLLPRRIEGMHLVDVRQEGEMARLTYDVRPT